MIAGFELCLLASGRGKYSKNCLGLFGFLCLPFGLCNGLAAFQRIMYSLGRSVRHNLVYLDDIVIYSANETEHAQHIQLVFDRLRTAGLRLKSSRCQFGLKQIKLLGFIITDRGIANPAKIEVIQNLPPPWSVCTFLGMTSCYRQFVVNYDGVNRTRLVATRRGCL